MSEKKDILWRAYLVYFGFAVAMIIVVFKVVSIQSEGVTNVFETPVEKIPTRIVKRTPRLGEVLDINRTPLVTSVSKFDIYMDPMVPSQENFDRYVTDLSRGLSQLFPEMSSKEYENHIRQGRARKSRYLLIKKKVTNAERRKINELPLFKLGRYKGGIIDTDETIIRKRPHGEILKRTIGYYQAATRNGKELRVGIEGAFHEYLVGEAGEEVEQRISTGWKKTGQIVKDAVDGADIVTSIDKEIQEVAHTELNRQLKKHNAKSGSVIVMDVKTGFVKAIVNLTQAGDGEYYELYNHAIGTKEVPGSTFKLFSLMAALEDDKIKITDTVLAQPKYTFYTKTLSEAHGANYGRITIKQAFEKSSNVISKVIHRAYRDEPDAFVARLKSFGIDQPLGLDLEGEAKPTMYVPGSRNWWAGSIAWMSIGYEVQQTPMQTLALYNAVANNGKFVKPQFVKEIRRGTEVVKQFEPVVLKQKICSDKTLRILKSCLEGVMKNGTGRNLTSSYFEIAGKTGTARILNDDLRYGDKGEERYLASFVGYFPVKSPIYSCIVSVTANGENIYGSTVSGTVFSAIANKVYATSLKYHRAINVKKNRKYDAPISKNGNAHDLKIILKKLNIPYTQNEQNEWVNTKADADKIDFFRRTISKNSVPNVIGMSAKDAVYLIENTGMHVIINGVGTVVKQTVPAGSPAYKGGLIEIILE
ncbi:MAG: PASTA domain-containing protein [Crocinitomicaceae bacterium]|nr:MAG: PASTA domain-containing protein [Crocinitomicaceae bacterium]